MGKIMGTDKNLEEKCMCSQGDWCCYCVVTLRNSVYKIKSKILLGHAYCYECYPKIVDVFIADQKLKASGFKQ